MRTEYWYRVSSCERENLKAEEQEIHRKSLNAKRRKEGRQRGKGSSPES